MYSPLATPLSLKQMMKESIPFKICFVGAISLVIAVIIMVIVVPFTRCSTYTYYSCTYYYGSYYNYECYSSNSYTIYCCSPSYSYCGDSYCYYKPSNNYSYGPCFGIFIAMWVCSGVCFILMVATFIMFCNFQGKARKGLVLMHQPNYANCIDSSNQNPIYVSSNNQPNQPIRVEQPQNIVEN